MKKSYTDPALVIAFVGVKLFIQNGSLPLLLTACSHSSDYVITVKNIKSKMMQQEKRQLCSTFCIHIDLEECLLQSA